MNHKPNATQKKVTDGVVAVPALTTTARSFPSRFFCLSHRQQNLLESAMATTMLRSFVAPGLRQLLPARTLLFELRATQARSLSTSPILRALRQQPAAKPIKSVPSRQSGRDPLSSSASPSSYAFIKSMASKATPTTLYEGPSHFWFYFGCWASGIGIISWSLFTGGAVTKQPEGVPEWVGLTYGVCYMLLCGMAFFLIMRTHNIVSRIRVLPAQAQARVSGRTSHKPTTNITATSPESVQLEVTVKGMLPFLHSRVLRANLEDASLKSRFSLPEEHVPRLKRLELKEQEEAARKELHKFDMNHLMTMPFRRLGRALVALFRGFRGAWTNMGFGVLEVNGKQLKVDVTNGFAHDGFRTLEKLLPVVSS